MRCVSCGEQLPFEPRFCPFCGRAQPRLRGRLFTLAYLGLAAGGFLGAALDGTRGAILGGVIGAVAAALVGRIGARR